VTAIAVRLVALAGGAEREVSFAAAFAADGAPAVEACLAPAQLRPGDGSFIDLGLLAAPSAVTWREQRILPLVAHRYTGGGPYRAELLLDGAVAASTVVGLDETPARSAAEHGEQEPVPLFALLPVPGSRHQRVLRVQAPAVLQGQRLRLDAGAGQVREFAGEAGQAVAAEVLLTYPKPGTYTVSLDLLDGEGFWLATLAQAVLEIAEPADAMAEEAVGAPDVAAAEPAYAKDERAFEPPMAASGAPWLPYRNIKAKPGGTRTYSAAGGGAVRRWVGSGVWLTVRRETMAGGARWYQTAGGDWVKADSVVFFEPSDLRGVTLDATAPPPPPPPPPPGNRKGVVTASVLNVRARPGTSANNPPVATLRAGAEVVIYEEQQVSGENWYRIGASRWVAARFVRVVASRSGAEEGSRAAGSIALPFGWVVPDELDVRNKPGVGSGSLVVDQLEHYRVVPVLEEATANGARWYRIGDQRWVEARQVGVARRRARPASIGAEALWVAVNLSQQTAVCYEGDRAVYAALAATGLAGTPTVQGIFRTWRRLDTGKMSGPGYYIEDVTWTCYFYSGYALHTAYWHDKFGRPRSHGFVNLSPYDAWWIYQWSAKGGPNSPTVYVYWA
jgi:hypothetical protein